MNEIADGFLAVYPRGRTTLACDTANGVRGRAFADDLAAVLRQRGVSVFRARLKDFCAPSSNRYLLGKTSPLGRFEYAFDLAVLRRVLLEPFRLGGSTGFVLEAFDKQRDQPRESRWVTGPADAVLIVDGPFLNRSALSGAWNQSLWLFSDTVAVGDSRSAIRNAAADTLYRE